MKNRELLEIQILAAGDLWKEESLKNKIKKGGLGSNFYVHLIKFQNNVL